MGGEQIISVRVGFELPMYGPSSSLGTRPDAVLQLANRRDINDEPVSAFKLFITAHTNSEDTKYSAEDRAPSSHKSLEIIR